ncbi:SDR family NAD(P)-dependent oxidoreductase [Croceibacterium sp. TMG7-5b_MA50]|uniref:SDR family NAD(P)-dependent oxidoreductase n=1 Tax=Croceibacterium sp. TMG7-5b_MA50 TaxID=3121290 RepID=UPI00322139C7
MSHLFIWGLGYSASHVRTIARIAGWQVTATGSAGDLPFDDEAAVARALHDATHVLSSVPPVGDSDPVLDRYAPLMAGKVLAYLSSAGVYGDAGGAWVDESAPVGTGRRTARSVADARWLALGARVLRLPGIYGPGRSALERVADERAHRIDLADQVFSRVHVHDIASGVMAALGGPPGAYNLADDLPASQNAVIEEACRLLGRAPPPLQSMEQAQLSPMARGFYAENRRVANGRAKRVLGWLPRYPDYRSGLTACLSTGGSCIGAARPRSATTSPTIASTAPVPATVDQR